MFTLSPVSILPHSFLYTGRIPFPKFFHPGKKVFLGAFSTSVIFLTFQCFSILVILLYFFHILIQNSHPLRFFMKHSLGGFGGSLLPHPSSCLPGSGPHRSQKWASSLGGCGSSHPSALYDLLRHDRGPKRRSPAHKALFPFYPVLWACPSREAFVFITGLLCGYPMGARMDSRFLEEGRIELNEARTLLAVSNHPSPMFILGYICVQAASLFSSSNACPPWIFLTALYLPILPVSFSGKNVII